MTQYQVVLLLIALALTVLAGVLAAADAALSTFSKARAEALVEDEKPGAKRVLAIAQDPAPYINTAIFVRAIAEVGVTVLVSLLVFELMDSNWQRILITIAVMGVVSYIAWGVAPKTIGRQRASRVACALSPLVSFMTTVLGPIPQVLILIGNALTPGRGYSEGPFSSEAELREMVDMAEASDLIEAGERKMIHSVFELGDSIVKEVMVPRTEVVYIEEHKTLRQAVSLALRSGYSRIPVVSEGGLDDVLGVLYLKDLIKRVYDNPNAQTTERVASMMRTPTWCPDSKPVDELLREMQLTRSHLVVVVDEFGGTAGLATIEDILEEIVGEIVDEYDAEIAPVAELGPGRFRVLSRLPVDELGELFNLKLDDEEVDTVGGLMAKELHKVPIPGSVVRFAGLELVAERGGGRRHQVATVLVTEVDDDESGAEWGAEAASRLAEESAERAT